MKRNMVAMSEPAVAETLKAEAATNTADRKDQVTFAHFALDNRLLQAAAALGWIHPTPVQKKCIPELLNGKDVVARASTGSGKTAGYLLPCINKILVQKKTDHAASTSILILVPTMDLVHQVASHAEELLSFCAKDVLVGKLTDSQAIQHAILASQPDIVISTPGRAIQHIEASTLSADRLAMVIFDEADLILSYGLEAEDLKKLHESLPKGVQTALVSATISTEAETLKDIFCRDPVYLNLEATRADEGGVIQYVVKCGEDEKFLFTWLIFKLHLLKGKCIIFVNSLDRSFRLKLFLESVGIRSCVLNHELPVVSRVHIVKQFSKGVYELLIASDEIGIFEDENEASEVQSGKADDTKDSGESGRQGRSRKKQKIAQEYGVGRGVDFRNVAGVLNFDLPTTASTYIHRIGRTGRAGRTGIVLSFCVPRELYRKHPPTSIETAKNDERVLEKITKWQAKLGKELRPWEFDRKQVEAFRYRLNDVLRSVTTLAVREARVKEIRSEILNSCALERYFDENPEEMEHLLRHDKALRSGREQAHLKHIPSYLLPEAGRKVVTSEDIGFVPFWKEKVKGRRKKYHGGGRKYTNKSRRVREKDPLKSLKARRK